MKSKKITINITPHTDLSDAVCKAIDPKKSQCEQKGLHQTVKSSIDQELVGVKEGSSVYYNGEWRNQIGIMLG